MKTISLANVKVEGPFDGCETMDRNDGDKAGKFSGGAVVVDEPIDMLYRGVDGPIKIVDSGKKTVTTIERKGFPNTCIWNPVGDEKMVRISII